MSESPRVNQRTPDASNSHEKTGGRNVHEELITIATFASPHEAGHAKSLLEEAGIRAFLANEALVSVAWQFTNAIGGIRLEVPELQAEEARAMLAELEATDPADLEDAWKATAAEADVDEASVLDDADSDDSLPQPTVREDDADRALRGAIFGLFFFPLQFYVFFLLAKVLIASDERLRPKQWRHAILAALINFPLMTAIFLFLTWLRHS
jgi:hypothetical protein